MTTTVAGASSATVDEHPISVNAPLISEQAAGYQGNLAVVGGSLRESFEKDGVVVSIGPTSLGDGIAGDEVVSFGYVAGFGDPVTGENYAPVSGQAGADVSAVHVVSATGVTTTLDLADGMWRLSGSSAAPTSVAPPGSSLTLPREPRP